MIKGVKMKYLTYKWTKEDIKYILERKENIKIEKFTLSPKGAKGVIKC